jgi:hypothetical protein
MPAAIDAAPAGDAERRLLEALAQHYGADPFSARAAAADIPRTLWQAAGVARPDAASCGRWLRSRRSATLVGRPSRTGVVRWQLKAATGPAAALQAPVPASHAPAPPPARQPAQRDPAPPAQQALPEPPQHPWWHMPATPADLGLPGPRWGCGRWWAPAAESAP